MAKQINVAELREATRDERVWCGLAIVQAPEGSDTYYEIDGDDVYVDVALQPLGQPLRCRLGAAAGSPGGGAWRIPPQGTEVAILIPSGSFESDCMLVATLASGTAPANLNADDMEIVNPDGLVAIQGSDHPLPKFDTFESALDSFLNSLQTQLALGTSGTPAAQSLVGMAAITTAVTTLRTKLTNGTFDSTKAKNG